MADDMIVIDASALGSIDYAQYLKDYFAAVGTAAGQTTYYGGDYSANVGGYFSGSQFGVRYSATANDKQVLMEGSAIQYDGVDGVHHGAYSGNVDSITFGAYDGNTKYTQGDNNGARSELTGVIDGLVVSNLDISTAFGTTAGPDNQVKTLMDMLKNAGVPTDGVQANIQKLYDLFASRAQHFIGSDGNDNYVGTAFGDLIDGGQGDDTLAGGLGDDTYVVDSLSDSVKEDADSGTDTIQTSVSHYDLKDNVENMVMTGTADLYGYGNGLDNVMTGNSGANTLMGFDGNDTLDGGAGADTLIGGKGDDTYYLDVYADTLTEKADEGTDTIVTAYSHLQIRANIENLIQSGTADQFNYGNELNNTMTGNSGNSNLYGMEGTDTLIGGEGNDVLDGGTDADVMTGGVGNDTYGVDNAGDVINEVDGEGTDTVQTSLNNYKLGKFLENLTILGAADDKSADPDLNGSGNGLDNTIIGNGGANILAGQRGADKIYGGAGNDTLNGGKAADTLTGGLGIDTLTGGKGGDTFVFADDDTLAAKNKADTITDFHLNQGDKIDLHGIDADEGKKGDQDFTFIVTDAFSGKHAAELRFEKTATDTYIYADTDGDGAANFTIHLDGSRNVTEDFFTL